MAPDNAVSAVAAAERFGVAGKCLVMTGGTSGIGRRVLERLLRERPNWVFILIARASPRVDALKALPGTDKRLAVVDADLASLNSVDRACDEVIRQLGAHSIDALALNAGVQMVTGDFASVDGLELSFAVNFLAHFLIVERLKAHLRPGGRIVLTSSEVHDPEAFCLMGIGRATWQDPLVLADPAQAQEHIANIVDRGEARYCASKLLNLMHARHLALELPNIGVMAFNPSVVPGTDIGRDRNWLQRLGFKYMLPLLAPIVPGARLLSRSSGDLLWLLTEADVQSLSGQYVDGRIPQPGSAESNDPAKIARAVEVAHVLLRRSLDPSSAFLAPRISH